jgi:methionyl-tRNA formyltransferase
VGLKIVFMGSATFALPSLNALFESGSSIGAVITQPDKPRGRGQLLQSPPVTTRARELGLPVYQPASLKTEETRELFRGFSPDLIAVVAYGKILPPWLLQLPKYGCINLHGSLLPKYRGAAPVHWAIANGEEKTGVCTMLLDEGLDTGAVFRCQETPIGPEETAPELYDRLALIGAPLLVATIEGVSAEILKPTPQDDSQATFAPILKKEHGIINWMNPATEIHNRIRAFNPWPGTVTRFRGTHCKILKTAVRVIHEIPPPASSPEPGALRVSKGKLTVFCGDGIPLEILSIQPENRKAVSGADFANGSRIQPGEKFEALMDN